jgi:hypothetical protein
MFIACFFVIPAMFYQLTSFNIIKMMIYSTNGVRKVLITISIVFHNASLIFPMMDPILMMTMIIIRSILIVLVTDGLFNSLSISE